MKKMSIGKKMGIGSWVALIFYSSRYGYDEPPKILSEDDGRSPG